MTHKQISKDNRIYWNDKIENKFDEKKEAVESLFLDEISQNAEKQYPKFLKVLGIGKDLLLLEEAQRAYNDFVFNKQKTENKLWFKLCGAYNALEKKWGRWSQSRKWEKEIPSIDKAKDNILVEGIHENLKDNCYEEVKKAFYKSAKSKELQKIEAWREQAKDVLHSDMIGSEVLKTLQNICKQSNIAISIPTESTLKIKQGGE
mgnify:CR=1 FL=1|tara:strand:+ start:703 stop:1314 length:612 start_codon:yes stop_codon:yes gene_type:complete